MVAGHVGDDAVLLARRGDEFFAIGATCTHYNGPLAEGLMVGDTVRCPWHHACFSLRTGEALHAPALASGCVLDAPTSATARSTCGKRWSARRACVSHRARNRRRRSSSSAVARPGSPRREMLRRQRYQGSIVMLSDDAAPPVDRPNLSKDYLAGTAPEEWVPLRDDAFYTDQRIDLRLEDHA